MEASRLEGNVLWHSSFRSCHRLQGNVSTGRPNNKTAFQLHQEAEPYRTCTPEYILRRHRNGKLFEAKYLKDILENQARVVFRSQKSNKWHLIWDLYRQSMDTPRVHEMRVYSSQMFSCWANRTDYPGGPYVPGLCDKGHTLEAFRCAVQGSVESVEGNHSSQEKCLALYALSPSLPLRLAVWMPLTQLSATRVHTSCHLEKPDSTPAPPMRPPPTTWCNSH